MEFKKYQHIERFGTTEVEGIEFGKCYIFPKIDGTNSSVWLTSDLDIGCGSRKRTLSLDNDNAGFMAWAISQENILEFLMKYPYLRLFGEWLVPHSLKTYRSSAWNKFYVFDVTVDKDESEILHGGDSELKYLSYDEYVPMLEEFGIEYIPPIAIINNPDYEKFIDKIKANIYLIEDGNGVGEGIVIKNYEFRNKYNRQTWAKIVTSEFKEKHSKEMGGKPTDGKKMVEVDIVDKYITTAFCEKVKAKIEVENDGFGSRDIPRLLQTCYYDLINEECWNFVKENKNPTINFKTLTFLTTKKVKECLPYLF